MAENIKIVIDRAELDAILGQTRDALDDTKQAKTDVTNFLNNEGEEIKGAEQAGKRILKNYLPGAREALAIQRSLSQLSAGNMLGAIGLLNLALMIYQKMQQRDEEQKQKFQKLEDDMRRQQGYSREQFNMWYSQQSVAMASSYQRPVNR
ncbi:MAG: hypothetical protein FWC33_05600 [Candidatus Bathyarchaeota archaeon]|nr:hypothetical protein [Candidatus Termiticorpusculum sp.]